jgi:hypothetical protein
LPYPRRSKDAFPPPAAEGVTLPVDNDSQTATPARAQLGAVYAALREILKPYRDDLAIKTDKPGHFWLETRSQSFNGRRLFFAAAKVKKKYVSYYLPPLFMFPELSTRISPALRKTMQGQSCFNFTSLDPDCVQELETLTRAGFYALKSKALL